MYFYICIREGTENQVCSACCARSDPLLFDCAIPGNRVNLDSKGWRAFEGTFMKTQSLKDTCFMETVSQMVDTNSKFKYHAVISERLSCNQCDYVCMINTVWWCMCANDANLLYLVRQRGIID